GAKVLRRLRAALRLERVPGHRTAVKEPEPARLPETKIRSVGWALRMMTCRSRVGFRERVHFRGWMLLLSRAGQEALAVFASVRVQSGSSDKEAVHRETTTVPGVIFYAKIHRVAAAESDMQNYS